MPSKIDLCNQALALLGQEPIIALDNNNVWGKRCITYLPQAVRTVLSLDIWRSATKRTTLAAESVAPLSYTSAYPLPADFLRLGALRMPKGLDWTIEGNKLLTRLETTNALEIMYVYDEGDPNKYSPTLYNAIAYHLAHQMSGFATTTTVRRDEMYQLYMDSLTIAQNVNAIEYPPTALDSTDWIDARFSNLDRAYYGIEFGDQ